MAVTLTEVDGAWVNGVAFDAGELRRADAALVATAGIASGLAVSVDGADLVTVTAGKVIISGDDAVAGTGVYRAGTAASVTGTLEARDATNGRIDLVVFRQLDVDVVPAHVVKTSRIEIIKGTPSATPAVPAKPSMAVELARITVPVSGGGAASVNSANRVAATAVGVEPGGPWTAYTPTLTNITLGSGTVVGRYRVIDGKTVVGRINLVGGAGTTASGNLLFSIPPIPMLSTYDPVADTVGVGNVNNNTSASRQIVAVLPNTGLTQFILAIDGGIVTSAAPFTFGSSSRVGFEFRYEAA